MFSKSEFSRRQKQLMQRIGKDAVAIVAAAPEQYRNRDADYPYRPDSDFYYLTGFIEPEAIAVFIPGRKEGQYVLFCREKNPQMETWTGRRIGVDAAPSTFAADQAFPIEKADEMIPALLQDREVVYSVFANDADYDKRLMQWMVAVRQKARAGVSAPRSLTTLDSVLHEMRLFK
ncbi:MAG: aminopeptidase P N-terminal domain-containing protein, partial [Gammaproteobacteria bacterium]|nr:aminopeptidase P N-terminal domain-containing protein [Gammaproteobacteria bacterium]